MGTFLPETVTSIANNSCDEYKESSENIVIPEFAVVDQISIKKTCAIYICNKLFPKDSRKQKAFTGTNNL